MQKMTATELIRNLTDIFKEKGLEEAQREAELLVSYLLDMRIPEIYAKNPDVKEKTRNRAVEIAVERYEKRIPLAYLLGQWHFYGKTFQVNDNVLIPRQETENLVEMVLNENLEQEHTVLDIGTGSGNIALCLGHERPEWNVYGVDFSRKAIRAAELNRVRMGLSNVHFRCTGIQFYDPLQEFTIIASNPPYVSENEIKNLEPEVRKEPEIALTDGEDGLNVYRMIRQFSERHLSEKGKIYLEIAPGLVDALDILFRDMGELSFHNDYQGNVRIMRIIT